MYHLSLLFGVSASGDDDDGDDSGGGEAMSPSLPLVRRMQVRLSELAFSTCSELSPKICVSGTANEIGGEEPSKKDVGVRTEGEGVGPIADIVRKVACTASLSHLRTMLPKSISCPKPAQRPNHAT